jgi:hypothetical protein
MTFTMAGWISRESFSAVIIVHLRYCANDISSQADCRAQRPQDRESVGFPSTQANW